MSMPERYNVNKDNIVFLETYRESQLPSEEFQPEHTDIDPQSTAKLKHVSSAVSVYQGMGLLTNEANVKEVLGVIKPPNKLENQADLNAPHVRDFYAKFLTLATHRNEAGEEQLVADQFMAAKLIYRQLRPAALVLNAILQEHPHDKIPDNAYETATKTLDIIAEQVADGRISF